MGVAIVTHLWLLTPELAMIERELSSKFQLVAGGAVCARNDGRAPKVNVVEILVERF